MSKQGFLVNLTQVSYDQPGVQEILSSV